MELARVQQGKTPFYLKKGEFKKLELVKKFKQLQGQDVDKLLEKKRKRNASKQHTRLPKSRRSLNE